MSDVPVHSNRLFSGAEPAVARAQRTRLIAGLLLAAVMVSGAAMWWLTDRSQAAEPVLMTVQEAETLAKLTDAEGAELVLEGESAQDRNALIPLSGGTLQTVAGFSAAQGGADNYGTALKCMTQAIYYEAANEPTRGKRAVAQVVLNRMRHPAYPSSVCGVVYDGANKRVCQFSFTCDGSLLRAPMARQWKESLAVAKAALNGTVEPTVGTATHYHADYVLPRWAYSLGKIEQIGAHIFYRFKGRGGTAAAFTSRWTGREAIPALNMARLRDALDGDLGPDLALAPADDFVPGLTVIKHVTDRHAEADVGGRIDTTKEWRLSIPDPVAASTGYRNLVEEQRASPHQSAPVLADAAGRVVGGVP